MHPTQQFTSKAEKYARYRWGYAPQAAQFIFEHTHLPHSAVIADIGSGSGLLTRIFLHQAVEAAPAGRVYAVEPNEAMRRQAELALRDHPAFVSLAGRAEATALDSQSIDLITVAQAIHWFEPEPTRREFRRIIKPGGWLAIFNNELHHPELSAALEGLFTETYGFETSAASPPASQALQGDRRLAFYFGGVWIQKSFPQTMLETWESFFGAQCSISYAPDETHPRFAHFETAARQIFERFAQAERIEIPFSTELSLGQLVQPG